MKNSPLKKNKAILDESERVQSIADICKILPHGILEKIENNLIFRSSFDINVPSSKFSRITRSQHISWCLDLMIMMVSNKHSTDGISYCVGSVLIDYTMLFQTSGRIPIWCTYYIACKRVFNFHDNIFGDPDFRKLPVTP